MVVKRLMTYHSADELYDIYLKIYLALEQKKLQPKVECILRYFIQYGISKETYDKILKDKVVPKMQSISNAKTELFDKGLLEKRPKWSLNKDLRNITIEDVLDFHLRCKTVK